MRIIFSLTIALLFVGCGGGGGDSFAGNSDGMCDAFSNSATRIFNGQECRIESLPVVRLEINGGGICTGTIISNEDVLTAAHCVAAARTVIATHDRGSQAATAGIANPLFFSFGGAFDIGLLKFPNIAMNFGVIPARFNASTRIAPGSIISVIGYGFDGTPALANGNPRAAELRVTEVANGGIFTLFDVNDAGTCFGDSGAAATLDGTIVGTVQGGSANCAEGNFNSFSDLQINGNVDFIKQYVPSAVFE